MADLLTRPLLRREEPTWGSRVPWLAAIIGTSWALAAGLALCLLLPVIWWLGDGADTSIADPLRFGSWLWLLAHRADVVAEGAPFSMSPLGLTFLIVLLMYRSARWATHTAGVKSRRGAIIVIAPSVVAYATVGAGIAHVAATDGVSISLTEAVTVTGAWALTATTAGVAVESGLLTRIRAQAPLEAVVALRAGAVALAGLLGWGLALVAISLLANTDRIGDLTGSLAAGGVGTLLLIVACLAYLPNVVVWAMSFSLGPGFAIGVGTSVSPAGVHLGLVPAFPLLGGVPTSVSSVAWLAVIGPVAAGALAGYLVHRELGDYASTGRLVATGAGAGAIAMVGAAFAASLSSGSAGDGRLGAVGPVPGEVALSTLVVIGMIAGGAALLLRLLTSLRTDQEDGITAPPEPVADE